MEDFQAGTTTHIAGGDLQLFRCQPETGLAKRALGDQQLAHVNPLPAINRDASLCNMRDIVPASTSRRYVAPYTADPNPAILVGYRVQLEGVTVGSQDILGLLGENTG